MTPAPPTTTATEHQRQPFIARTLRLYAVPIIMFWVLLTVALNVAAPSLEVVSQQRSAPIAPDDAPSMQAMARLGRDFKEFDSNSTVVIIVEGQQPLGADARAYYDTIIRELRQDPQHIQHIQDFWSDRITAAGVQSADRKAAYVMLNVAGNLGETLANESVEAVRDLVQRTPAPDGVKAYVTGPAALTDDIQIVGNASLVTMTMYSIAAIAIMLFVFYRSVVTTAIQLFMTGIALGSARGVVAVLGHHNVFGLTTSAANILTMLAIAAGTDYGIFFVGRYQEARTAGEDPMTAIDKTFRGVAPVVLGSGLTIAGATLCLSFARLPWFHTMVAPVAIGMVVVIGVGLTLVPATLAFASRFGLLESKRTTDGRLYRKVGTAVVRWPLPILAVSAAIVLIGMIALPGYRPGYNDRHYLPDHAPVSVGYAAADRHFSPARMDPDFLLIEADHDMRNPADMLVLDKVARKLLEIPGIAMVQDITRPLGMPIQHSSIPFQISMQSQVSKQNLEFLKDRLADIRRLADELAKTIDAMEEMYSLQAQFVAAIDDMNQDTHDLTDVITRVRDRFADFDDSWRPLRSAFYWEKHCYHIPICWSFRSLFDALDGIDQLDEELSRLTSNFDRVGVLQHQVLSVLPPQIESLKATRAITLTFHSTLETLIGQQEALTDNAIVLGQSFDTSRNSDLFYLPPEAFDNPDFQAGLRTFVSGDGKSARFLITHEGDPASPEGISRVDVERTAARQALKQSSLSDAKVYLGGTAATFKDMHDGEKCDLTIAVLSSLTLIFTIMLLLTRSLVAAMVIVGTAASSIAAAFGLSVLIWQNILGANIHWALPALSVIILLAVGSDYNLLLVLRLREEIHAGLKTGIIRSMARTGEVVTAAGLAFAATMAAMLSSELLLIGQFGLIVSVGLLLDTIIVRLLLMPAIATLLGRWFWWPQVVHPRGADNAGRTV
ncbi:MMPL family RND transporter [Mycobacterium intermedium]|uniref:MMPL family RND transporter n=1 Tax=Mycobacterium intermedium TaxID=28445 RepID=A0A1E3S986_MYCIE|nr:hypothetical protein BHQ20_20825 [Mycobacterium intermedium]OPE50866.1 hypothetical protein BV508_08695 [Mycobacterium intermedium]ORB06600.1 MMPL family RND transporter [Mycobacterium intermedium]